MRFFVVCWWISELNQMKYLSKLSVIQNQLCKCQEIRTTLLPPLLLCVFSCVITRNRREDGWKEGRKQRKVIKMECCRKGSVVACDHQMQLHWTGDDHGINRGLMLRRWWEKLVFCVSHQSERLKLQINALIITLLTFSGVIFPNDWPSLLCSPPNRAQNAATEAPKRHILNTSTASWGLWLGKNLLLTDEWTRKVQLQQINTNKPLINVDVTSWFFFSSLTDRFSEERFSYLDCK